MRTHYCMNTLITELQIYTDSMMIKEAIISWGIWVLMQQTHNCPSSVTLAFDFFLVILIFFLSLWECLVRVSPLHQHFSAEEWFKGAQGCPTGPAVEINTAPPDFLISPRFGLTTPPDTTSAVTSYYTKYLECSTAEADSVGFLGGQQETKCWKKYYGNQGQ